MGALLNLIGLSAGIALYAMLLLMVLRARRAEWDPLLLVTAVLGLVWNLCALPAYELPQLGVPGPFPLLNAIGFSALGFLPAAVVHSVLRGEPQPGRQLPKRIVAFVAYGVSATAAVLQFDQAAAGQPLPSVRAMQLLTYTFIALVMPLGFITRRQPGARRALWAAALSIFAVSALHLSGLHQGDASWGVELLGHHASVPLAIAILYQDFPFAFADLFLKRALTLLVLVTAAFVTVVSVGLGPAVAAPLQSARNVAVLVTLWVATALLYPKLRDLTAWFVDTVVLDRPDYPALLASIARHAHNHEDITTVLDNACAQLAPALSARTVRWLEGVEPAFARAGTSTVDIPVAERPTFVLEIGGLKGGRRLLSGDLAALDGIARLLGRRIDAIRLSRERYARRLREEEMAKLATEAELRALRSQVNPHFLFNALTTIGYLIQTTPARAIETLLRLTALLRGVLRSDSELTTSALSLTWSRPISTSSARAEERSTCESTSPRPAARARTTTHPSTAGRERRQTRHRTTPQRRRGVDRRGTRRLFRDREHLDHRSGHRPRRVARAVTAWAGRGVGLRNVERRLECAGAAAGLKLTSVPGHGTVVLLRLPVASTVVSADRVSGGVS